MVIPVQQTGPAEADAALKVVSNFAATARVLVHHLIRLLCCFCFLYSGPLGRILEAKPLFSQDPLHPTTLKEAVQAISLKMVEAPALPTSFSSHARGGKLWAWSVGAHHAVVCLTQPAAQTAIQSTTIFLKHYCYRT